MVIPPRRLWLVSFHDAKDRRLWTPWLRPGFGHCCAIGFFADQDRWVYFNPTRHGSTVALWRPEELGSRLDDLVASSAAMVRFESRYERRDQPAIFYCVGALKALLGIESSAWTPYGLYRDLLRLGGHAVECGALLGPDDADHLAAKGDGDWAASSTCCSAAEAGRTKPQPL